MKRLLCGAALAALMSTSAMAADVISDEQVAEDRSGLYVTLAGGIKFGEDWDDEIRIEGEDEIDLLADLLGIALANVAAVDTEAGLETDGGWRASAAVGYQISSMLAAEIEVSGMWQDFDSYDVGDFHITPIEGEAPPAIACVGEDCAGELDGDLSIVTVMANALVGLPLGGVIVPYVGVGAGVAFVSLNDLSAAGVDVIDDSDTVFAAQAFAGAMVALSDHIALGIRGRILHVGDVDVEDEFGFSHSLDSDLIKSVEATLTFAF